MRLLMAIVLLAAVSCSFEDTCERCYDADYYYEHPYFCQECLQEQEDKGPAEASDMQ